MLTLNAASRPQSLVHSIQRNRQRNKYQKLLARLLLRRFDYEDAGPVIFDRYEKLLEKIRRRIRLNSPNYFSDL